MQTFQKHIFWDKKFEKQTEIATHMDLWKYGQNLTIQKSLITFSKTNSHMSLLSCITIYIESQ
jgi:hypothetical protein